MAQQVAGRNKHKGEDMYLPDKVVGFAMADDYNDMRGMYVPQLSRRALRNSY